MKLRVGTKLNLIRTEKRLSQDQIADLLGLSTSAYARLERNETAVDVENLTKFSKALDVPIHEFLPETFQINNTPNYSQGGLVFGNFYYYASGTEHIGSLHEKLSKLEEENIELRKKLDAILNKGV